MTVNIQGGYLIANEGCFYWGWYVACDLQIYLFLPLLIYILEFKLRKIPFLAHSFVLLLLGLGAWVNYRIIYEKNFSAGLFAPQDIWIF
mmetsp:Transcript_10363/g.15943  ORF Transcript_10363/g.15943 Transcript_10363/m.15943 type:complete len:89 (+) Transcript_10363:1791-2057(+)